jgi:hypothetical protein
MSRQHFKPQLPHLFCLGVGDDPKASAHPVRSGLTVKFALHRSLCQCRQSFRGRHDSRGKMQPCGYPLKISWCAASKGDSSGPTAAVPTVTYGAERTVFEKLHPRHRSRTPDWNSCTHSSSCSTIQHPYHGLSTSLLRARDRCLFKPSNTHHSPSPPNGTAYYLATRARYSDH